MNAFNSDLWFFVILCGLIAIFFIFIARRFGRTANKVDISLRYQEQTNLHLNAILSELRRSNRFLAELAGFEALPEPTTQASSMSHVHPRQAPSDRMDRSSEKTLGEEDPNNQFKVYVGNVDYAASAMELAQHFERCGQVVYVNIPVNRYTGRARGFGFVSFATQAEAERAMSLHGSEFRGREIQVNFAKERETQ